MNTTNKANVIILTICNHYSLSEAEFYEGRAYKCADARKIALRLLLDRGVAHSITKAANLLQMERSTASIALKTLSEVLPYCRMLREDMEAIIAKCDQVVARNNLKITPRATA